MLSRFLGLLLLAAPAVAQQSPVPPVPPLPPLSAPPVEEDRPGDRPGETPGRVPLSAWTVFLGFYGGYDSNVDFLTPDDPGDAGAAGYFQITHYKRSPRGQFGFNLDGGGVLYQEVTDANQVNGSAGLSASYRASTRAILGFTANASYQSTDLSRTLIDAGLQLPRDQTLIYGGTVNLDLQPGDRTKMIFDIGYSRVDFDSDTLVDSETASGIFRLERKASSRSDVSLQYGFMRNGELPDGFDSHYGALGWTHTMRHRLSLSLSSGAGYSWEPQPGEAAAERWYYYGTAGLTGQIRRSTVDIQLRRSVNPAYGLGGNLLSWGTGFSAIIPIGRRVRLTLFGVHTWSDDPVSAAESFISDDAHASLSVTFLRRLGFIVGYNYRRNDPADSPAVTSHRGSFGLTYLYSRP